MIRNKCSEMLVNDIFMQNHDYDFIDVTVIDHVDYPNDIYGKYIRSFYTGSYGGFSSMGALYNNWSKNFIDSEDNVIVRNAIYKLQESNEKLFERYKNVEKTPLYYINDSELNIKLKNGDIIVKSVNYTISDDKNIYLVNCNAINKKLVLLELNPGSYNHEVDKCLKQEEQFYEWLSETGKEYLVYLYGNKITITDLYSQYHTEGLENFFFKSTPGEVFKVIDNISMKEIADEILKVNQEFYTTIYPIYKKNYGELEEDAAKTIHRDISGNKLDVII